MNPMNPTGKDKRNSIRIPLISDTCYMQSIQYGRQLLEIKDITNEGMFVECDKFHKPGEIVSFEFTLPGDLGEIFLLAQVKRIQWVINKNKHWKYTGMGLEFCVEDPTKQKTLDAYVLYLRNKQIISVSKRIVEQFLGPKKPKSPDTRV